MLMSRLLAPTLREVPAEAEIPSHRLMLRAGLIRKSASGIYTYLPLGLKVLQKIMQIIREEMNAAGGQELLLPIIQPAELWFATGRWDDYGAEMFKLKDRHERQFCLGPTHEEIITALAKAEISSYRQMPLLLYQIQNKYRDEIRPRFGVIRGREFIMKDLYSFDQDEAGLEESYRKMYDAYTRIFTRCGLDTRPVDADPGAIGGSGTHEFMVLADSGEAELVICQSCDYAANVEIAPAAACPGTGEEPRPMEAVETPAMHTVDQVTEFLQVPASKLIKTLLYLADGQPVAVLVRGDHECNEVKLKRYLGCTTLELADEATIAEVSQGPKGFTGPVGLQVRLIADHSVMNMTNAVTGANRKDTHLINVNPGRDFTTEEVADLRVVTVEDPCPKCQGKLQLCRGIEVGQVFKLGTKYSAALKATFTDENGEERPIVMGCYGIGVSRTMAAIIEQNYDEDGIIWPMSVAPYQVVIVPIKYNEEEQRAVADELERNLTAAGISVVLDDRDERPGVKFKDADLIGFPIRITIGPKGLAAGNVEISRRDGSFREDVKLEQATEVVVNLVQEAMGALEPK